jgi:hypothetical protein
MFIEKQIFLDVIRENKFFLARMWIKKKLFCGIIRENKIFLAGMWLKKRLFCGIIRENKIFLARMWIKKKLFFSMFIEKQIFLDVLFWMVEKKHGNGKSCSAQGWKSWEPKTNFSGRLVLEGPAWQREKLQRTGMEKLGGTFRLKSKKQKK